MIVIQVAVPEALKVRIDQERENFSLSSYACNILAHHIEMVDDYRTSVIKYNL
jgi:hypothetical protein